MNFIEELMRSSESGRAIGISARSYILEHFDAKSVLNAFNERLESLILKV